MLKSHHFEKLVIGNAVSVKTLTLQREKHAIFVSSQRRMREDLGSMRRVIGLVDSAKISTLDLEGDVKNLNLQKIEFLWISFSNIEGKS